MRFNVYLAGVGGEGVLTAGTLIAMAAHHEGRFVRGVQLHGLAQRGGSAPTIVRFGDEKDVASPGITEGEADLILAFEPMEAVRSTYYATDRKTSFVIDDWPYMPICANLRDLPYPSMTEVLKRIEPFAKKALVFQAHALAKKEFGSAILGNTMLLGAAVGAGLLPLKPESFKQAIPEMAKKQIEENIRAFSRGIDLAKRGK